MFTRIFVTYRNSTTTDCPYDGPYKVVARSGRVFEVMIKGKVETMTAIRVKPAHIERKPEMSALGSAGRQRRQNLRFQSLRREFVSLGRPW